MLSKVLLLSVPEELHIREMRLHAKLDIYVGFEQTLTHSQMHDTQIDYSWSTSWPIFDLMHGTYYQLFSSAEQLLH